MITKKINKEAIGKITRTACEVITLGALVVISSKCSGERSEVVREVNYIRRDGLGYDDAVSAITHSHMFSLDKKSAITALKRDQSNEYYGAVIEIANSDMYSLDKVSLISDLSKVK